MEILAQVFGIVGMCFNIFSYQMKKQHSLISVIVGMIRYDFKKEKPI